MSSGVEWTGEVADAPSFSRKKRRPTSQPEGGDEIETKSHTIEDDEARLAFVDQVCRHFYLYYVFLPAIEAWADETNTRYTGIDTAKFSGKAADLEGESSWYFLRIRTSELNENGTIVGISGAGQAATFVAENEGTLEFSRQVKEIKNRTDLIDWLNQIVAEAPMQDRPR